MSDVSYVRSAQNVSDCFMKAMYQAALQRLVATGLIDVH